MTAPVGLCGVVRLTSFVRGVIGPGERVEIDLVAALKGQARGSAMSAPIARGVSRLLA